MTNTHQIGALFSQRTIFVRNASLDAMTHCFIAARLVEQTTARIGCGYN